MSMPLHQRYYLAHDKPRDAMKHTTIIFYQDESAALGTEMAKQARIAGRNAVTRDASSYDGAREDAHMVVVLPNVKAHFRKRIEMGYGKLVQPVEAMDDASLIVDQKPAMVADLPSFDGAWPVQGGEPAANADHAFTDSIAEDLSKDPGPEAATFQVPEVAEKPFREPNMKRHAELNVMPFAGLLKLAREHDIKNAHQMKKTLLIEQILELEHT